MTLITQPRNCQKTTLYKQNFEILIKVLFSLYLNHGTIIQNTHQSCAQRGLHLFELALMICSNYKLELQNNNKACTEYYSTQNG